MARSGFDRKLRTGERSDRGRRTRMRRCPGRTTVAVASVAAVFLTVVGASCRTPGTPPAMPASPQAERLFVAHCAACHGANGRGNGLALIALEVRPRDFLRERFRYVSTSNGVPTQEDLVQTIRYGRRFGEMPANPQLTEAEALLLADYVREINRLGWAELLAREFADDDETTPEDIQEIAEARVTPRKSIVVSPEPRTVRRDLNVGRELFEANCMACHGPRGRGDGLDKPLDEQGRPIAVRDLTSGEFRGGVDPADIFLRIRCGIPGTPMSAAAATDEEVWQLVHYVEFLAGRPR